MSQRTVKTVDCDLCSERHERQLHALGVQIVKLEDALAEAGIKLDAEKAARIEAERKWGELVETTSRRTDQAGGE